jgi:1-phosphofructokinase family hexose kinase
MGRMILCIGTTPAAQRVMVFRKLELDGVNRASTTLDGAAGKSINVAKVLASLGERPVATGFIGGERGRFLLGSLASKGIETQFVTVAEATRQCISVIDETECRVTELVEESRPVAASDYVLLKSIIWEHLPRCEAVVMSGSLTPGGPVNFYKEITQQANEAGILSVVDAQGLPLTEALEAKPGLVKPNRRELGATVHQTLKDEGDVIAAMRQVHKCGAVRVVVTAGRSATLALNDEALWGIQSPSISAVNPIGSGDAFTAALVWRLVNKENLGEACRWAAAAGAANALSAMPGELERGDIEQLLGQITVERL